MKNSDEYEKGVFDTLTKTIGFLNATADEYDRLGLSGAKELRMAADAIKDRR